MEKRITAFFDGQYLRPEYPGQLKEGYKYELIVTDVMAASAVERHGCLVGKHGQNLSQDVLAILNESMPAKGPMKKNRTKRKRKKRR